MKKIITLSICVIMLAVACATKPASGTAEVEGLISLDEAMKMIAALVESRVEQGSEVGIAKVESPLPELSDFLYDELLNSLGASGKLVMLARGKDTASLGTEQQFQMSGLVSDESAVGIGQNLGAKVMITASFSRFANFSQFSVRVLDVKTGTVLASNRLRINNNDLILASVTAPLQNIKAPDLTEIALDHFNRGMEFGAEGKLDNAIEEFDKAIALNKDYSDAWYYRGVGYHLKDDTNRAIADYNQAIQINPNYFEAYYNRGYFYSRERDYYLAVNDFNQAIQINPNFVNAFIERGNAYLNSNDYDSALADYTQAIRINPNYYSAYNNRGIVYYLNGDYALAIADLTQAIRINPNIWNAYNARGIAYKNMGDNNRAIADFNEVLRLDPNNETARQNLEALRGR